MPTKKTVKNQKGKGLFNKIGKMTGVKYVSDIGQSIDDKINQTVKNALGKYATPLDKIAKKVKPISFLRDNEIVQTGLHLIPYSGGSAVNYVLDYGKQQGYNKGQKKPRKTKK